MSAWLKRTVGTWGDKGKAMLPDLLPVGRGVFVPFFALILVIGLFSLNASPTTKCVMNIASPVLPPTATRVEHSTSDPINAKIEYATRSDIARVAASGMPAISRRLRELDHEWDVERTLETNAASIILVSVGLGLTTDRRWFAFPAVIAGFLLQHALQGWCPPLPILRRLGVRTLREIELERTALRILRGDFAAATHDAGEAFRIAKQALP